MKDQKITLLFLFCLLTPLFSWAQNVQTIRGNIIDRQSEVPLIGVAVELLSVEPNLGTATDLDGSFAFANVPLGRHTIRLSYLGYETVTIPNIIVDAGKETVLNLTLVESLIEMSEITVTAQVDKDQTNNEMATISARSFNLEEVTRFSGGRNDVARLASNFAGVAVADDSRNDIVIRGNSPTGVLWQLEGIPIPNPNHFSTLGTTGGPVSALNPNLLDKSDFLTSAFPSEYGNAISGVFDVGFRSGNKQTHEYTLQLAAFSGLEAMAEGPINRDKKSSYLVSYRHSFVGLADELGIPVGTNATPNYRDLSFKLDFGSGKAGKFSVFGIGGTSDIDFLGNEIDENDLFANPDQDAYVTSTLGILGVKHNIIVGENAYVRTVVSASSAGNKYVQDNFMDGEGGEKLRVTDVDDRTNTFAVSSYFNKKYSAKFTLRTGILAQYYNLRTQVDDRDGLPDRDGDGEPDWVTVRDFDGWFGLFQAFAQSQYRINHRWTLHTGLHSQYLDITNDLVLEPRVALNYQLSPKQKLNLGYGLHHQMQPMPVFFYEEEVSPGNFERTNEDLAFIQSHHFVLGYENKIADDWRLKSEVYYQAIQNAAVESFPSSFSLINAGADFIFPETGSLRNDGTGTNYGIELTLEKFFTQGYYTLVTASIFDSQYKGSDGIERNTAFNNGYVLNALAGKEWKIGSDKRNALTFDMKFTTAGGRYYTPIDVAASQAAGTEILQENIAYSERFDPYLRLDVKFGFRMNSKNKKLSQQFFLDLQNVTDNENIFTRRYNELTNEVNNVYQSGFFPDILYRIQF